MATNFLSKESLLSHSAEVEYPIKESHEIENSEIYDYILAINNPFDVPEKNYICHAFLNDLRVEDAKLRFRFYFKSDEEDPFYKEGQRLLDRKLEGQTKVKFKVVAQVVVRTIIKLLQDKLQLEINLHYSQLGDQIFIKLRSSENNLKVQADLIDYKLQFKADKDFFKDQEHPLDFQAVLPYGAFEKQMPHKSVFAMMKANPEDLYQRYDTYERESESGHLFKYVDKVRLVHSMIVSVIELGELANHSILYGQFPQHNYKVLDEFDKTWITLRGFWKPQDIEKIRNYFGEKIAMYFAWLEMYTQWLVIPAFFGIIFGIIIYADDPNDTSSSTMTAGEVSYFLFAIILSLGSTFLDQIWVRKQNIFAWKWGLSEFETKEEQRPEYKGKYKKDIVSGKMKKVVDKSKNGIFKNMLGFVTMLFFVGIVIATLVAIFIYRASQKKGSWGPRLAGAFNAFQIKILNFIYRYVARSLTEWENYETASEFQNALTIKLFSFQFVNSYASLFYMGFVKGRVEGCDDNDCMNELELQLGMIYVINLLLNLMELGIPFLKNKYKTYRTQKAAEERGDLLNLTIFEKEANLSTYETPLEDYMEMIIGYGYVALFAVAFPFSPLLAIILCVLEFRVDAWKLCKVTQRVFPAQDNSIGVWMPIIQILSYIGCATNIALIIFTTDVFDFHSAADQWIAFIVVEHSLFALKFLISAYIPDVPEVVKKGVIWSNRVMNEKLYGKYSDVDKEREIRQLNFEPSANREKVEVDKFLKLE
ncbi:unnamed protein product [Blepharisma stoltei]|uniref:Anoctamin transmembrane domain-containing protein n=1 Tax=Blepharisma stoltei TaxID=1481888 RepID=A0AAU9J6R2_9CILI|nr:unnamed protein product [Blepharisma stoltei]